jgi:hypothetical protein
MKKTFIATAFALALALAPAAWAFAPELHNEDGKAYDYSVACGGSSTSGHINGHTTTSLSLSGSSCTLLVKGAGLGKLAPNGSLSCK